MNIRFATIDDAEAILSVYAPYVLKTANTFEYVVPTVEEFTKRIKKISAHYPYLVCECFGEIVGYAYGSQHRERMGYSWCAESTIYLDEAYHRRGIARALYRVVFALMKEQGYHSVYVSILCANMPSIEFHKSMGFEEIGVFKNIGYKLGEWHSNNWMQLFLNEHGDEPGMPVGIGNVDAMFIRGVLAEANKHVNA